MATVVRTIKLSTGENVFYREAGNPSNPTVVLLHGFPSSSHQYRNLIPRLAHDYHVLAPDYPGFGFTTASEGYKYTFANLANTTATWLKEIPNAPSKYAIYIFDYGAPVGLQLALKNPEAITAIVSQNGNAYEEGLGAFWDPIRKYWASGVAEDREAIRFLTTYNATYWQYTNGAPDPSIVAPEAYTLDQALMERPGNAEIQLDLFYDYRTNLELYPKFHEYFRKSQVPLLAVWAKNDEIFVPPGAEGFKKDLKAEVHLVDAGHFALETSLDEVAVYMLPFLRKHAA